MSWQLVVKRGKLGHHRLVTDAACLFQFHDDNNNDNNYNDTNILINKTNWAVIGIGANENETYACRPSLGSIP